MSSIPPHDDLRGLYTSAMLAEWLRVPVTAIRHWHRRGYLLAAREVGRLAYFTVDEVHVARTLSQLVAGGCSLALVDRKVDELSLMANDVARPLLELPLVVEGCRILLRRGEEFTEVGGQRILDFESSADAEMEDDADAPAANRWAVPFAVATDQLGESPSPEQLREWAIELSGQGELAQAVELARAVVVSGSGTAEDQFTLGELLYRGGDLSAARERYFMAIELDENYVEARANLGCVLTELAEAAFRGARAFHEHYADAHYQLAKLLDRLGRHAEAKEHWQSFRALAPDSPWVQEPGDE
jgi:tetratricopeptide (TPR) repeat protein